MKNVLLILSMLFILCSGCNKTTSGLPENPPVQPEARETPQPAGNTTAEDTTQATDIAQSATESTTETDSPCLIFTLPLCEVVASDTNCDPKLNENHYKVGDQLYWVNYAQYDNTDCYYTEEEYNNNHNHDDCTELQNDGRGCIIDESPACNLVLDENCTVTYTRAYCDEELLNLNKDVGQTVPGVFNESDGKTECFYTEKERRKYLKSKGVKCQPHPTMDNLCVIQPK